MAAGLDLREVARRASGKDAADETPLVSREHSFMLRYDAPNGTHYSAPLTARILNGDERARVARASGLIAGVEWTLLPTRDQNRIHMLAHLTILFEDAPDWLFDWLAQDDSLLVAVYEEVAAHEQRYFRRDAGEGDEGAPKSRVAISSSSAAPASS